MKSADNKKKRMEDGGQPFLQLTKRRATAWGGVFLFVVGWVFLLGVLVGRGTAPVNFDIDSLQEELATLRQKLMEKERQAIEKSTADITSRGNLEFHEKLKKTEVEPRLPGVKSTPVQAEAVERPPKAIPVKTSSVRKEKPVERPENKNTNQAKAYTIQVAATRDRNLADRVVADLKRKGLPAYRVSAKKNDGVWYRIRVGYYTGKSDARHTLDQVRKRYKDALLVKR